MQKCGFREVLSVPSHVIQRVPIYILYKIMPVFLSRIDNFLLKNWPFGLLDISSHEIKVFKQQGEKEEEKMIIGSARFLGSWAMHADSAGWRVIIIIRE